MNHKEKQLFMKKLKKELGHKPSKEEYRLYKNKGELKFKEILPPPDRSFEVNNYAGPTEEKGMSAEEEITIKTPWWKIWKK